MKKLQLIKNAKRTVIKIGSSLLIDNGKFNYKWLRSFVDDIDSFLNKTQIIIVASGAVSLGKSYLKFNSNEINLNMKQAFAACGQIFLMNNFIKVFEENKKKVAQILLTFSDTENRRRSLNSRETIKSLLLSNVIPIINENDTVATDELKFGDNDRLAARVAQIVEADLLILLTDVKGLFNKNPRYHDDAKLIETVTKIDSSIYKMATSQTNSYGSGGMFTKIQAAEIAGSYGCNTLVFQGNIDNPLKNLKKNDVGSVFVSDEKKKGELKIGWPVQ
jgi:glutamate 5-kinase